MENEVSELLYSTLMAVPGFSGAMAKFSPLYADEDTPYPFAVYNINDVSGITKDNAEIFDVFVVLVYGAKGYTDCLAMKNVVKAAMKDTPFYFQDSDVDYDNDNKAVVCAMRFQITHV